LPRVAGWLVVALLTFLTPRRQAVLPYIHMWRISYFLHVALDLFYARQGRCVRIGDEGLYLGGIFQDVVIPLHIPLRGRLRPGIPVILNHCGCARTRVFLWHR